MIYHGDQGRWDFGVDSSSFSCATFNMATTTELLPPNVPVPPKIVPTDDSLKSDEFHGLKSKWPVALDLAGSNLPCRLEGEVENLVYPRLGNILLHWSD